MEVKLRKIGNSVGAVLSKEILAAMNAKEGDVLYLTQTPDGGFRITTRDPEFARTMDIAKDLSRRYRNALSELAK